MCPASKSYDEHHQKGHWRYEKRGFETPRRKSRLLDPPGPSKPKSRFDPRRPVPRRGPGPDIGVPESHERPGAERPGTPSPEAPRAREGRALEVVVLPLDPTKTL